MDIAIANGITEPINGSWEQAICVSLGITESINGSWLQALAQYGPFDGGGAALLDNTASVSGITYGEVYQDKGIDVVDIQIYFDLGVPFNQDNVYKSLTFAVTDAGEQMPFFLYNGSGTNPVFVIGALGTNIAITDPIMVVVGESYDITMTMFTVYQDDTTAPQTSLPIVDSFTATP